MAITTTTHLNFRGTAREALAHYRDVLGGAVHVTTYAQLGMPADAPGADRVVFGRLDAPAGLRLMAYDVPGALDGDASAIAGTTTRQQGATITDRAFFQSLEAGSLEELQPVWDGLAEGGAVIEPLAASEWSAGFGMLTDRFGVTWSLSVVAPAAG